MSVIEKAFKIAKKLGLEYKPKQDSNWFEYYDTDGFCKPFEEDQDTYCESCSDERKIEILKDKEIKFPTDFDELTISTETSKENEDFLRCDSCGEIIESSIIWTEQELDHWNDLKDQDWKESKSSLISNYEVMKILEHKGYGATEEFPNKCEAIARKVIENWGNQSVN